MKKVAIMQPYLFPYIGYFQAMKAVDEYVIYDDVNYIKGGWINRNNILVNGHRNLFTIKLKDSSANKKINEIEISDDFSKFQKTLQQAYAKAPYKETTLELVAKICSFPDKNLARFVENSFREINSHIHIDTKLLRSSDLKKDTSLRGQDKVINICKELSADMYVNAIGGRELYSKDDFKQNSISLKFLQTGDIKYKQMGKEFVPWLSIIDVMMFNSPVEIKNMLGNYELI